MSALDGGRPVRPAILAIEGHIEEIVLLKDDAERFRRGASTIAHLESHMEDAHRDGDTDRLRRAGAALVRLAQHLNERARQLVEIGIPEVQRCISALESVAG